MISVLKREVRFAATMFYDFSEGVHGTGRMNSVAQKGKKYEDVVALVISSNNDKMSKVSDVMALCIRSAIGIVDRQH